MKVLVKVSGDLVSNKRVIKAIKKVAETDHVTVIHGAGTQISNALKKEEIPYEFRGGIRYTTEKGLKICLRESQKVRKELEKKLKGMNVSIISPVSKEDGKIINKNSEEIFRDICTNFDRKIIFTASDREKPLLKGIKDIEIIKIEPLDEDIMRP